MATELTELAALATENMAREWANVAIQTDLDSWAERSEFEARMSEAAAEVDVHEPREWVDVVSYGEGAVVGFLVKLGSDLEAVWS